MIKRTFVRRRPGIPFGDYFGATFDVQSLETSARASPTTSYNTSGEIGETWESAHEHFEERDYSPWSELSVGRSAVAPYCAGLEGLNPA